MHFFYPGRPHAHRVAACDDDPTDGFGYWALTTSEAPDDHRLD